LLHKKRGGGRKEGGRGKAFPSRPVITLSSPPPYLGRGERKKGRRKGKTASFKTDEKKKKGERRAKEKESGFRAFREISRSTGCFHTC